MVMDDREEYTAPNLFPGVQETKTVDFTLLSDILEVKKEDYLVVVTRGHSCDADVERFALRTPASYIGVVGSKRKTQYVREKLLAEGFTNEELDRVHAPIGIDIASETPAELSVLRHSLYKLEQKKQDYGEKTNEKSRDVNGNGFGSITACRMWF